MEKLFYIHLVLGLPLARGISQTVECSDNGQVTFDFVLIETTSVPRYRLERIPRSSDANCAGTIEIVGVNGDIEYILAELGMTVFQNLTLVNTINLPKHSFDYANRDMFFGSPNIETINLDLNLFKKLDGNLQFNENLKTLVLSGQTYLNELKSEFFANQQSLTELDLSEPRSTVRFSFEDGALQSEMSLEKLYIKNLPIATLEKSLFSNHAPSLKHVDMSRWVDLTSVEYNAFSNVALEELILSEWPFLDADLFSGASIRKLDLNRAKFETFPSGSFAGLQDCQEINLSGSALTSFDSGAFDNFTPLNDFKLAMPKDISCCNMDGLRELINVASGISINNNLQNYTCQTPDKTELVVVDILKNEDPAVGFACCDYEMQYYNDQNKLCERCKEQDRCADLADTCRGEETDLRTCNKCNDGFAVNPFECQACTQSSDCLVATGQCSLSAGFENTLQCTTCVLGLSPNPVSGICEACIENSPSCLVYDTSCILGTQNLACVTCNDETELIEGSCVSLEDTSLPLGVIIGISVGIIVVLASVSITVLIVCLYRRKKRKERKLNEACGILKNESGVEIYPVEFDEFSNGNQSDQSQGGGNTNKTKTNIVNTSKKSDASSVPEYHNSNDTLKDEDSIDIYHNMEENLKPNSAVVEYHNIDNSVPTITDDSTVGEYHNFDNSEPTIADDSKVTEYHNFDNSEPTIADNSASNFGDSTPSKDHSMYANQNMSTDKLIDPVSTVDDTTLEKYHNVGDASTVNEFEYHNLDDSGTH